MKYFNKHNGGGATLLANNNEDFGSIIKLNYNLAVKNYSLKKGFTLAEVLITLAIVGIVAAMTIPTLVHKYQAKVLKTQFVKAYSLFSQQLEFAQNDYGINLGTYCSKLDVNLNAYVNKEECYNIFDNYLKMVGKCEYKGKNRNYSLSKEAYVDIGGHVYPDRLLSNGVCYKFRVNSSKLGVTIDINGASSGPNALGHDIFVFHVAKNKNYLEPIKQTGTYDDDYIEEQKTLCNAQNPENTASSVCLATAEQKGYPCSKKSNQKGNGIGCSWYALNDVCPDDEAKSYWECLP